MRGISWLVGLVPLAVLLVGCDVGSSIEAENNTDQTVLARISMTDFGNQIVRFAEVVTVPARTRLFIAQQPFDGPRVDEVEILATDCRPIADFVGLAQAGGRISIEDGGQRGPYAVLHNDFPTGQVTATRTDACPGTLPALPASGSMPAGTP